MAGHKSTGGMRCSMYNAMPLQGIKDLVKFMKKFQAENPVGDKLNRQLDKD